MKYLTDYTKDAQSALFKELHVMFAFSDDQLIEAMAEHNITDKKSLVSLGAGLILPRDNVKEFMARLEEIVAAAVVLDLAENGRDGVLERELGNHEIGYSFNGYRDQNFQDSISDYGFTPDEIKAAYYTHMEEHEY